MAEIIQDEGHGKKGGKKRAKKHGAHLDMTPMVDLMCLLITFFMLTTAFNKPKVMQIILPEKPKDQNEKPPEINKSRALNIIMTKDDKILWYNGLADPNKPPLPTLNETDYSKDGIRKLLLQRNKELFKRVYQLTEDVKTGKIVLPPDSVKSITDRYYKEDQTGPIILIKAADSVKYKNVVDIIDEMVICNIARYSLTDINLVEKMMVRDYYRGSSSVPSSN